MPRPHGKATITLGKEHSPKQTVGKAIFGKCLLSGTRRRLPCRVSCFAECIYLALGKEKTLGKEPDFGSDILVTMDGLGNNDACIKLKHDHACHLTIIFPNFMHIICLDTLDNDQVLDACLDMDYSLITGTLGVCYYISPVHLVLM